MRNARTVLKVFGWIWIVLVLPFAWVSIQVIEQLSRKGFPQNLYDTTLGFLFLPGWPIILACSTLGALLLVTIITGIIVLRSKEDEQAPVLAPSGSTTITNTIGNNRGAASQIGSTGRDTTIIQNSPGAVINLPPPQTHTMAAEQQRALLHRYLNSVIAKNKDLNPTGIHQSQALLSVNVPLDEIFIHIRAVSERPIFDIGIEQQKLLEEIEQMRRRADLDAHEREEYVQGLRAAMWHSQLGEELLLARLSKDVKIEDVLQCLTPARPATVLLGSPGSGKSTTMRWLALHMARAKCLADYQLPQDLAPVQIPLFLTIGDYAKAIAAPPSGLYQITSVKEFFYSEWKKISPDLPALLEDELLKGYCLLLFDGLDEVASDPLRDRVRKDLYDFISLYPPEQDHPQAYNRVLITSRIVGYEPGPFAPFALYTLLDLNDEQIEQFLTAWCPAVESYQTRSQQGMQDALTAQQEQHVQQEGQGQRDRLLEALHGNPGIRRLAVNPLMLTILALIQKSGHRLPHRRIELYQTVTLTLLNNWNQFRGRVIFSPEECDLAEEVLSEFAYRLHSRDLPLTEKDVFAVTRKTMARYYRRPPEQIQCATVETFIDTLRSSSSLFVERGQGLYGFLHRTFQEYFVMRYLVDTQHYPLSDMNLTSGEELKAFVQQKCHISTWHEPLLLLIAYKSEQRDRDERQQATTLIQTILASHESYDAFLQRHLLLAASALTDCNTWYIDLALQQEVANQLFDIYGDLYGVGRYTALQKDIEKNALLWLRDQPQGSDQQPPLLEAWHTTLCDSNRAQRQYGAALLLASIAHNLSTCPAIVLHMLIPPLLHLAGVQDWYRQELTCPPEIQSRLLTTSARPSSSNVEDCALVTLRLLDEHGPAGWLHTDWLRWSEEQPGLLQRLTHHTRELNYLLTPAAFPAKAADPNWDKQLEIGKAWQDLAQHALDSLQTLLLQTSNAARYPQAILFKRLLSAERSTPLQAWLGVWERILQQEMQEGHAATYQSCFFLRLLLARHNQEQQQRLTFELLRDIETPMTQIQALKTFAILGGRGVLSVLDVRDMRGVVVVLEELYPNDVRYVQEELSMHVLLDMLSTLDMQKREQLVQLLCSLLLNAEAEVSTPALLAIDSTLNSFNVPSGLKQQVQEAVTTLEQQRISAEQRQLLRTLQRHLSGSQATRHVPRPLPPGTVDQRLLDLHALQQNKSVLNRSTIEEILAACTDTRETTSSLWNRVSPRQTRQGEVGGGSVEEYAWQMVSQAWYMDKVAQQIVVQALDDDNPLICAAAALLLQRGKDLSPETKQAAGTVIMCILANEERSRRPLYRPGYYGDERLDDVLFETLRVIAEGGN